MPERVVDHLELVEVDVEQRDRAAAPRGLLDGALEVLLEHRAIGQPGQRVVVGEVGDPLLRGLALGDVADRAEQHPAAVGVDARERDGDRELRAVLAHSHEVRATQQRLNVLVVTQCRPAGIVEHRPEALGEQLVPWHPHQVLAAVPEHHRRGTVHEHDAPALVGADDAVGGALDDRAELCVATGSRLGSGELFALGGLGPQQRDVGEDVDRAADGPAGVPQRPRLDDRPALAPAVAQPRAQDALGRRLALECPAPR